MTLWLHYTQRTEKSLMHQPSKIILEQNPPILSKISMEGAEIPDKETYEATLASLQHQLLVIQQAYYHQKHRAIIVLEGWDASGKGGSIRKLTRNLDPRGFEVHNIRAPHPDEQGRHYLYRFQRDLPKPGHFCIFDRSYYGRVLVERVEELCKEDEWQRAYQELNEFERLLMDDNVKIVKNFLHITPDEQLRRFQERLTNPLKRWKLTQEDIRNRDRWDDYVTAIDEMFARTSTEAAPWCVIPANKKWYARIQVLKNVIDVLSIDLDTNPPPLDQSLKDEAFVKLGIRL